MLTAPLNVFDLYGIENAAGSEITRIGYYTEKSRVISEYFKITLDYVCVNKVTLPLELCLINHFS